MALWVMRRLVCWHTHVLSDLVFMTDDSDPQVISLFLYFTWMQFNKTPKRRHFFKLSSFIFISEPVPKALVNTLPSNRKMRGAGFDKWVFTSKLKVPSHFREYQMNETKYFVEIWTVSSWDIDISSVKFSKFSQVFLTPQLISTSREAR